MAQTTQATAPSTDYPGKTLGIVGFVLCFIASLVGLILSIIAFAQSKKAGVKNNLALAGIIVGSVFTAIGIIVAIASIVLAASLASQCAELGAGSHYVNGATITCGSTGGSYNGYN